MAISPITLNPKAADVPFFWIPPFTHPDVSSVTFGGFYAGRWIASQPGAYNAAGGDKPVVADSAAVGSVAAATKRMVSAWRYISMLEARKACANLGPGYHLMTQFEGASIALWCNSQGFQPHGNDRNTNPLSSSDVTTETAILDQAAFARNNTYLASLTGSGPASWNHNNRPDGIADLDGNMWEWRDGLLMQATTGYPYILASLQVSLARSPYGKSTAVANGVLTDVNKAWIADEFLDASGNTFVYDAAGTLLPVAVSTPANTATTINVAGTPAAGPYTIVRLVATDITAGITNGTRVLTLRNTDADLKAFAIPATSDSTGATAYGKDGYWFDKTSLRAALVGGYWNTGTGAGVFALNLNTGPASTYYGFGFRVARAI